MDVGKLRTRLLVAVGAVAVAGLAVELWHLHTDSHDELVETLVEKLSLSYEANVPTWFASSLLLGCAIVAILIARDLPRDARWRRHWWGVAAGLGWVSLDETAELHEHLGGHFGTSGVLYFDWVIVAAAVVLALALVYAPFIRALPTLTRRRLVVAAAVYVGGALLMELPLGWWTERAGTDGLGYALIDWVEETLELVGATLALTALVAHRQEAAR